MIGSIQFERHGADGVARVVLANVGKRNAIDVAMWRELRSVFEGLQRQPPGDAPRAVIVSGASGQFASGGDIVEFAQFRFDEVRLHDFHEHVVAPALQAMQGCDVPLLAQIEGACINKRTLRQIARGGPTPAERRGHFGCADSADHREGVTAFIEKRPPRFERG